ncbi:hypothetical protein MAPG_04279 [Magnaporthiopsis poae ATCC 64411]|uniref:Uncharacterized protein n=1 Tax=Magnaporthiopsis poae (strain ATCC 64411 / 73-15) TaxID=644358 RepID=A0A0C4DWA5_MAGP6|nr:hypothetical protein MAPG_04279 [Magnaporthiopsis poae ATCC 64411]
MCVAECVKLAMGARERDNKPLYYMTAPIFLRLLSAPEPGDDVQSPQPCQPLLPGVLEVFTGAHDLDASDPWDGIFTLLQFGAETQNVEGAP